MESIFAKPPASTSHNYIYLLQKKEILSQNFKEQFSNNLPPPVHLYSSGKGLSHRKVSSHQRRSPECPVEESLTEQIFLHTESIDQDFSLENVQLKLELAEEQLLGQKLSLQIRVLEKSIEKERKKRGHN